MSSLVQLSAEAAAPPRFALAVNGLRSGQALTWLCADDPVVRSALVESVIDAVADLDTRFVRAGNPLRAPLTIERLLIQAIGPAADLRNSRDPEAVSQLLATRLGDESRLILVLEQAETLDGESLDILHAMAPFLESAEPRVQFLLAAAHLPPAPEPMRPQAEQLPVLYTPLLPPEPVDRRRVLPRLLAGVAIVVLGVGVGVYLADPSLIEQAQLYLPARFRPVAAAPRHAVASPAPQPAAAILPQVPASVPAQPPAAASAPVDSTLVMRREFDEFLANSGDSAAKLTDAQKSELFDQFLAWRRTQSSSSH